MEDTMESTDQLTKKVIILRPIEQIRIVEAILYSLDKPDSEARYKAYKREKPEASDWDEIKNGLTRIVFK